MKRIALILVVLTVSCVGTIAQKSEKSSSARIAFYNVENLFDTIDQVTHADEAFTPNGKQVWTEERYAVKLQKLAKVIEAMEFPAMMGLCEVENAAVVKDLVSQAQFGTREYGVIHEESPDFRGIDVAFIYNKKDFKPLKTNTIRIDFPAEIVEDYTTRDILVVEGKYRGERIHFFINHWPSRRGGLKESEPKRSYVAQQLRAKVDSIFMENANANIVIMGDFNDETDNRSIAEVLEVRAQEEPILVAHLYNCFSKLDEAKLGSYNFRGNFNMLDQIIVSNALVKSKKMFVSNPTIFKKDWMIFKHEKFGETPNRTYGGPNYYGGISDHFPVYVDIGKKKRMAQ